MKIRFQADESLSHALIQAVLRLEPSIEFTTAQQAGALGLRDPEVLAVAARQSIAAASGNPQFDTTHYPAIV